MAKRRTAEETQDTMPAAGIETAPQTIAAVKQEPAASQQSTPPLGPDGKYHTLREPGEPQKSWAKQATASVIVDPEAGVKFHFDYERHKAAITFAEKPTPEILDLVRPILHEGKFSWEGGPIIAWEKNIKFPTREDDRREAKKTFYAVANAIREHKGLPARSFGEAIAF